ncbi:MAG TPA: 3-isopropylmalate dehydratase small subunit [Verrucomicrobiales bacterium]|nr:3-isopropylmalate dehydratase small subunit [Verrucomicrobiales bacterium]
MALAPVTQIRGSAVPVPGNDIDTDRIIPARFMKCVTFDGLGEFLFYDVRKGPGGAGTAHPLNDPKHRGASILLTGANFGCGSSREHAPQALYRYGIRAIIAESFAEIFFGNCTTLGIPCVAAASDDLAALRDLVALEPSTLVTVDLIQCRVLFNGTSFPVHIPDSARDALVQGQWDPIAELLEGAGQVDSQLASLGYTSAPAAGA